MMTDVSNGEELNQNVARMDAKSGDVQMTEDRGNVTE